MQGGFAGLGAGCKSRQRTALSLISLSSCGQPSASTATTFRWKQQNSDKQRDESKKLTAFRVSETSCGNRTGSPSGERQFRRTARDRKRTTCPQSSDKSAALVDAGRLRQGYISSTRPSRSSRRLALERARRAVNPGRNRRSVQSPDSPSRRKGRSEPSSGRKSSSHHFVCAA